ncbi:AAA family ATPase [Nocardia pseudovaccinii]|uniref:AAA family ATPase n=1 Tax=Nocardia pseudovaccinii TaxID=189540 RepID=UPI0014726474|nr:AAA family ATPase [Nocardia pseudovaccinii]
MTVHGAGTGDATAPTVRFVGRDRELEKINNLLNGSGQLITLIGPGGIGKTSLAEEAIRRFKAGNRDARVHWVRLARLSTKSDYAKVEQETARAVIKFDGGERSTWDALVETLGQADSAGHTRRTVVVFDNCEHVVTVVQNLIAALLEAIPDLTIVATSHGLISWIDEHVVQVPPLAHEHALEFFRQRAELIGWPLADEEHAKIASEICKHVHNNPLFIRLAAAKLRHQPLARIRDELTGRATDDKRLRWGHGPRAGAEPRQMGVTDLIGWSYNRCSDKERLLFDRMSVFAAGYVTNPDDGTEDAADVGAELEAIQAICSDAICSENERATDGEQTTTLATSEIQELLERLADQSLVTVHLTTTDVRYSLLESLRLFAWMRLSERGADEPARLESRHLRYYRDKVSHAAAHWFSPTERALVDWARSAWDNLLTAIETSLAQASEVEAGLQICLGLISLRIPFIKGGMRDIRDWTERCLNVTQGLTPQPTELQIRARSAIAWLAVRQGQSADAERLLEACAADYAPEAASLPLNDMARGTLLFMSGRDPSAIDVLVGARDKFHHLGDGGSEMMAGMFASFAAALLGTSEQAHEIATRCLGHARRSGATWATSWAEMAWGATLAKHGDPEKAADVLRHALTHQLSMRDHWGAAWTVEILTWAMAASIPLDTTAASDDRRHIATATKIAQIAGGIEEVRNLLGIKIASMGTFGDASRHATEVARRVLGSAAYKKEEKRGRRLRPDDNEVHRLGLGEFNLPHLPRGEVTMDSDDSGGDRWFSLGEETRKVAILAAAGYTNEEIAGSLTKSTRTVDNQISAILKKLDIDSRKSIADHIPDHIQHQVEAAIRLRPVSSI